MQNRLERLGIKFIAPDKGSLKDLEGRLSPSCWPCSPGMLQSPNWHKLVRPFFFALLLFGCLQRNEHWRKDGISAEESRLEVHGQVGAAGRTWKDVEDEWIGRFEVQCLENRTLGWQEQVVQNYGRCQTEWQSLGKRQGRNWLCGWLMCTRSTVLLQYCMSWWMELQSVRMWINHWMCAHWTWSFLPEETGLAKKINTKSQMRPIK